MGRKQTAKVMEGSLEVIKLFGAKMKEEMMKMAENKVTVETAKAEEVINWVAEETVKGIAEGMGNVVREAVKAEGARRIAEAADTKGIANVAMEARKIRLEINDEQETKAVGMGSIAGVEGMLRAAMKAMMESTTLGVEEVKVVVREAAMEVVRDAMRGAVKVCVE